MVVGGRYFSGSQTDVWKDPCLLNEDSPFVQSENTTGFENVCVADSFLPEGGWNVELINDIFNPRDKKAALQIPNVARSFQEDGWFWKFTKNGGYSVKSGYRLLTKPVSGAAQIIQQVWNAIWRISVLPKIKNFLWRMLHNVLPTCVILVQKQVAVQVLCPVCEQEPESIEHVLLLSGFARGVWLVLNNLQVQTQISYGNGFLIYYSSKI